MGVNRKTCLLPIHDIKNHQKTQCRKIPHSKNHLFYFSFTIAPARFHLLYKRKHNSQFTA